MGLQCGTLPSVPCIDCVQGGYRLCTRGVQGVAGYKRHRLCTRGVQESTCKASFGVNADYCIAAASCRQVDTGCYRQMLMFLCGCCA
jgi:hypothetical protein